ncbi:MAG: hypothetical protein Q9P01_18100 [Anaerolineae bacterium]|nr:hypothetical protein [Anaerolineae bacterium]
MICVTWALFIYHYYKLLPADEHFLKASKLHQETGQQDVLLQGYRALALLRMGRSTEGKVLLLNAIQTGDRDIFVQQQLQLLYIQGLVMMNDYVKCREQALAFVEHAQTSNQLLRAKGLLWLGISMVKLADLQATETLKMALEAEKVYGGLDTWWCHYWLAKCSDNDADTQMQYAHAAKAIQQRIGSLTHRPELHDGLKAHPIVQEILNYPSQSPK